MNPRSPDEAVVWMTDLLRGMIITFATMMVMLWASVVSALLILGHGVGHLAALARGIAWPTAEGTLLWIGLGALQRRAVRRLVAATAHDRP